jgi:hypothetical protein
MDNVALCARSIQANVLGGLDHRGKVTTRAAFSFDTGASIARINCDDDGIGDGELLLWHNMFSSFETGDAFCFGRRRITRF